MVVCLLCRSSQLSCRGSRRPTSSNPLPPGPPPFIFSFIQACLFGVGLKGAGWKKKTPKSLFGGRDHYEILEIDTEFQTFLDDFTILDLVGHIITTFRRGI